ncbi:MAG TPA: hypothetical protein VIJ95_04425 [Hanamia sp.]
MDLFMELKMETCWWASLGKKDLLELAYILSKNAIVLWDSYNFPEEFKDKLKEVKSLPDVALLEIAVGLNNKNENLNKDRINELYTLFVTPVLQIRDRNLKLPYVVKSAFLSVFQILKGMQFDWDQSQAMQCFSSSVTRSLDAIKISNIMTLDEISVLAQKYILLNG